MFWLVRALRWDPDWLADSLVSCHGNTIMWLMTWISQFLDDRFFYKYEKLATESYICLRTCLTRQAASIVSWRPPDLLLTATPLREAESQGAARFTAWSQPAVLTTRAGFYRRSFEYLIFGFWLLRYPIDIWQTDSFLFGLSCCIFYQQTPVAFFSPNPPVFQHFGCVPTRLLHTHPAPSSQLFLSSTALIILSWLFIVKVPTILLSNQWDIINLLDFSRVSYVYPFCWITGLSRAAYVMSFIEYCQAWCDRNCRL